MLDVLHATRYVVPLREGGSLPAVLDTDGGGLFVAKFRGAGQGARALVAEIVVAGLAEALGLPMPEVALIDVDPSFGRSERDPEIQDVLRASHGLNVGLRYLEGALSFDPAADDVASELAARIVWLDGFVSNLDRTPRNTNLMVHDGRTWLIDHGAALYFHHDWTRVDAARAADPFAPIASHVLLTSAGDLLAADRSLAPALGPAVFEAVLDRVPDALLMDAPTGVSPPFASAADNRRAYQRYFTTRLEGPRAFVDEAVRAQAEARAAVPARLGYRR